jgi:WD40 repeat protein
LQNVEVKYLKRYKDHELGLEKIKFLGDSNNFLTASHDKSLKLWNLDKLKPLTTFQNIHDEGIWDFDYFKKKGIIVSISPDHNIKLTELKSKKVIKTIQTDMSKGYTVCVSEEENLFLAGGQNGSVYLCDINGNILKKKEFPSQIIYSSKRYLNYWVLCNSEGEIIFLDNDLNILFKQIISQKEILSFTIFENFLFASTDHNNIQKFLINLDKKNLEEKENFKGHSDKITIFFVDAKNRLLFTGCNDGSIFVWDLNKNEFKHNLVGHLDRITSIDLNDKFLITCSWDQTALYFNLDDFEN